MIEPIRVFVGYDPREAVAYHVCCQSIIAKASRPVAIYPLALHLFAKEYEESHKDGSNAFIYSRFLVPWLCSWQGSAIFLDGDMILRDDIADLWALRRPDRGVQAVKHDYTTKYPTKYMGYPNEDYPRKNWSSVMLWNCGYFPNRVLTPDFVAGATGEFLHRFEWLKDSQIEALPPAWNHLTMEFTPDDMAKLLHFTIGIPAFAEYAQQEGADEWRGELDDALRPARTKVLPA
jgi:hypothetical protein